jgi:DNA recombination protein RmuC
MQALMIAAIAIVAGGLLGHWLGKSFAQADKRLLETSLTSLEAEKALIERRTQELTGELAGVRSELAQSQAESAARAGFQSLALEREKTIGRLTAEQDKLRTDLQAKSELERNQATRIKELETELENEKKNLEEKLALLDSAKQALAHQFEALAAEILEKKSKSFSEGSQKELGTLLTPLREQIKDFREKVEKAQTESSNGVTKLETLIGTLGGMNQQLSEEARNLSTALRGSSKAQGDWGEFILRDLLEHAGLHEGEQYSFQQSFSGLEGEDGKRTKTERTDVIVYLPGGRHLIIDSKVSLKAYTDSVNAETEEERGAAVKRHLASMRSHVDELAQRKYQKLPNLETPDFVVMFIPVEPAFLVALQEDEALWRYAYEKQVLLVGPTTLLFVIRIVDNLWQQELQARSVQDVMNRGAELYDKFVNFVNDLEAIGKSLHSADQSYGNAMKKLSEGRGNLIRQVEMLKQLGIRTTKSMPRNLLDSADEEQPGLALVAAAEPNADTEEKP